MILAIHINVENVLPNSLLLKINYGVACIGIPLFFMVSGYLFSRKDIDLTYIKMKIQKIFIFVIQTCTLVISILCIFDIIRYNHIRSLDTLLFSYLSWIIQKGVMSHYWYFASMIIIYFLLQGLVRIINSKYFGYTILGLIIVSFLFFLLDCFYSFERVYIPQTIRLWYWLMYFFIGAYIRLNDKLFERIKWPLALFMSGLYTVFQIITQNALEEKLGHLGNEFFFGSIFCMFYAVSVFCSCINNHNANNDIICSYLSRLFLPVYAFHILIYRFLKQLTQMIIGIEPNADYVIILIVYVCITLTVCIFLMKIPKFKNIMRI